MYKNQLQELAQRSCFNLPSYSCIREGPDHSPRFKATVNFNGETFESPSFCSTLRQAEHAAAEVALNTLANRGPSRALAARVLDETGVYKNLLQETAHRAGLKLPVYTTIRAGPGHVPVFSCTVELAGLSFSGEPAKTKKQAQKNAAMAAWSALKQLAQHGSSSSSPSESEGGEEQEQVVIARVLASLCPAESNACAQNDGQGHQRSVPTRRDLTPAVPNLNHMQQQENWGYSSFSPGLALYQMWQQAQLQSPLLAMPVVPSHNSLVLPQMMPVFHTDSRLYYSTGDQEPILVGSGAPNAALNPSFYSSGHSVPGPPLMASMVNIQEIGEENNEEPSVTCPAHVLTSSGDLKNQRIILETAEEEIKQKNIGQETKIAGSDQIEVNPNRQFEWVSHRSTEFRVRPVEHRAQNPLGFDPSQSNLRRNYSLEASKAPFAPPPVMIRTVGPGSPVGSSGTQNWANPMPAPSRMRAGIAPFSGGPRFGFGRIPSRSMAPAVQIRSVVPVCSAPPVRMMPNSSLVGEPSKPEVKNTGQEDVSAVNSELDKLRI